MGCMCVRSKYLCIFASEGSSCAVGLLSNRKLIFRFEYRKSGDFFWKVRPLNIRVLGAVAVKVLRKASVEVGNLCYALFPAWDIFVTL